MCNVSMLQQWAFMPILLHGLNTGIYNTFMNVFQLVKEKWTVRDPII